MLDVILPFPWLEVCLTTVLDDLIWPNNLTMELKKEPEKNSVKEMVVKTPVHALSWSAFSVAFPNS